jgi:hypothetical protein
MKAASDNGSQEIGAFIDWLLNGRTPRVSFGEWADEIEVPCQGQPPEAQRMGDDLLDLFSDLTGKPVSHSTAVAHRRQCVCEGTGYVKVPRVNEAFVPIHVRIQGILAEYYKINEDEAERERMALLDYVRAMNDWEDSDA